MEAIIEAFKTQLGINCIKIVRYLVNNPIGEESIVLLSNDLLLKKVEVQTVHPRTRIDLRIVPMEYHYVRVVPTEKIEDVINKVLESYCEFFSMVHNLGLTKNTIENIVGELDGF